VVEVAEEQVRLGQGSLSLRLRAIDGKFPSYRQLRPNSADRVAVLDLHDGETERRLHALQRLALGCRTTVPVVLRFGSNGEGASASLRIPDVGEHSTTLAIDSYEGEELTIALNPQYFLGVLRFAGGELRMTDALKPIEIASGAHPERWALLMPVRLS
jgi:DNA polymerase III sliding clamp (beta) subunit (PCNA family)